MFVIGLVGTLLRCVQASVRNTAAGLAAVVGAADDVIDAIDTGALAAWLGVKAGEDTPGGYSIRYVCAWCVWSGMRCLLCVGVGVGAGNMHVT